MEDPLGFHSRPAALCVQTAQQFDADVLVTHERGAAVNGKSIMGLLTLAIQCGEKMAVTVQGPDAAAALEALGRLLADAFGERQPAAAMMANEEPALFADTARQEDAGAYAHAER
jgi:phosphocarrier protein